MAKTSIGDTDHHMEMLARLDPYRAVCDREEFSSLDDPELKAKFFQTGVNHLDLVFSLVQKHFDFRLRPTRALDFGCGVGRILIPLAQKCRHVVGVDVSPSMLKQAYNNCKSRNIGNVELVQSADLTNLSGTFDFVHSFIVFQHIKCSRGERLFKRLLSLLAVNGVGAIHFTYVDQQPSYRRAIRWARKSLPFVHNLLNVARGLSWDTPSAQMNAYNLSRLVSCLYASGCNAFFSILDGTPGMQLGVFLFFQKTIDGPNEDWRHQIELR